MPFVLSRSTKKKVLFSKKILQCCPELHLGGLLPWHCRVTQFVHLGTLRDATAARIRAAFCDYSYVRQRYGR